MFQIFDDDVEEGEQELANGMEDEDEDADQVNGCVR